MPAWTDTFDESTDWTTAEFVNMFIRAHNERMYACNQSSRVITEVADWSTGIDRVSIWGLIANNVLAVAPSFIRTSIDPLALTINGAENYTPQGGSLASTAWYYTAQVGSPAAKNISYETGYTAGSLRRIARRWIKALNATTDYEGNSRAAGQKAQAERWITSTSDTFDTFGNFRTVGMIARLGNDYYKMVTGTGWVKITSAMTEWGRHADFLGTYTYVTGTNWNFDSNRTEGDILDSHSTAPDFARYGFNANGNAVNVWPMVINDFIGYWWFNELRDYLRAMKYTGYGTHGTYWSAETKTGSNNNYPLGEASLALAESQADSNYTASSVATSEIGLTSSTGEANSLISISTNDSSGKWATATGRRGHLRVKNLWVGSAIGAPEVNFYVRPGIQIGGPPYTWNDIGEGITYDYTKYIVWETVSPSLSSGYATFNGTRVANGDLIRVPWTTDDTVQTYDLRGAVLVDWTPAFEFP
jgi:hypothetical protein